MCCLWTENDSEKVLDDLASAFREAPRRFFTEHDLHSHLYNLVEKELESRHELFVESKDGYQVSLVHHEYPTPFRCDMSKTDFKLVGESDRSEKRNLFRRGHYDLVVLNPDFVGKFDAVVVSGKNYKLFCQEKEKIDVSPLLWVCEIVFGSHVEEGLPMNWIGIVTQDAKKIKESLKYKIGKANFAVNGSIMVFIGTKPDEKTERLESQIRKFNSENNFHIRVQTAI
jgi:hypothetical protein